MALQETIERFEKRNAIELEANAQPLPGPALEAFISGPLTVGSHTVRQVVAFDWRIWQATGNSIVKMMAEFGKPEAQRNFESIPEDESGAVAVWMLTHSPKEIREAFKAGIDPFKERCIAETEDVMETGEFNALYAATMKQVVSSISTFVKYAQNGDGDEKKIT